MSDERPLADPKGVGVAQRDRKHIELTTPAAASQYQSYSQRPPSDRRPAPDRRQHGASLETSLRYIESAAHGARQQALTTGAPVDTRGIYVEFESTPDVELKVDALEDKRHNIEVVAFKEELRNVDGLRLPVQRATVFVPDGAIAQFIQKFATYAATPAAGEQPDPPRTVRHHKAFDCVAVLRAATLRALWTDDITKFPADDQLAWWEVWLRVTDGSDEQRFRRFATSVGIDVDARTLRFDDRIVVLAFARPAQLAASVDVLDAVAELRGVRAVATGIERLTPIEQLEYVDDVIRRVRMSKSADIPVVCVLDTGINREHPLLRAFLEAGDLHAVEAGWGTGDHHGHGTEMAGLALFGDLSPFVVGTGFIDVRHRLESVKLLPPWDDDRPELYGAITAAAVARPEIANPQRRRIFSMAVTAPTTVAPNAQGAPTSWSAMIDALAFGRTFADEVTTPRLIVVSAGNVRALDADHLSRSDVTPVEDPAQAFNALTVGACTDRGRLVETSWSGALPVAVAGDLSPHSATSVLFNEAWPLKPDVVFEGSNVFHIGGRVSDEQAASLNVLTTSRDIPRTFFDFSSGTSAATAQVARMAANISSAYPTYWPETIRGLIVHSARWTPQMQSRTPVRRRSDMKHRVRRYGYGVPDEARALRSASDDLTLVHQGVIHPFANGSLNEMHLHRLPWPQAALMDLGAVDVTLRVTLSYFIEPNPARRGVRNRFRYTSHGLRFDMKKPTESEPDFSRRINKLESEDGDRRSRNSDIGDWTVGLRTSGSLHSDFWTGSAAALARRELLAVYPVGGWWMDVTARDRSAAGVRYALLVSIEAPGVEVDLWTDVMNAITTPIEV
jgi:hypothetical protein